MLFGRATAEALSPTELPESSRSRSFVFSVEQRDDALRLTVGESVLVGDLESERWARPAELPPDTPEAEAAHSLAVNDRDITASWLSRQVSGQVVWRIFRFERPAETLARLQQIV